MKKLFAILILFISVSVCGQEYNVMSFNIRLNTATDGQNAWPHRKDKVASQILFHDVQILGVQEALPDQMIDLKLLLKKYKHVGGGRDDGKDKGEYSAIFYDTTKLTVLKTETFWLSETPTVPGSKSWDAAITRIVTWAKFRDKKSGKQFFVFNTHFDHMGKIARKESALLLLKKIKEIAGTSPVIVTGDFNSNSLEEPIRILREFENPDHLTDTRDITATPHYGPDGTFNGFRSKEVDDNAIDFIFVKGKWKVLSHATISQTWGGRFASDHFAILSKVVL